MSVVPSSLSSLSSFEISAMAPFPWASLVGFMAGRAYVGLEEIAPTHYRRALRSAGIDSMLEVRPSDDSAHSLRVSVDAALPTAEIQEKVRVLFDVAADVRAIATVLTRDPILRPLVARLPGVRIPGTWHPFELIVRAILGQQISVAAATTIAGRLVMKHGAVVRLPTGRNLRRLFPSPAKIARAKIETLGIIRTRANAIRGVACAFVDDPEFLRPDRGLELAVADLRRLPGIGEWTAQYVAMRALREPDAFPASDLGLLRAYARLSRREVTPRELLTIAETWRPYRAYAAMYLWMSEP